MSTWKNVGMTYLKYADLCATHVRNSLKEPAKSKAMARSDMHVRVMTWADGKRGAPGVCLSASIATAVGIRVSAEASVGAGP